MARSQTFTVEEANGEVPRLAMLVERLQRCALKLDDERRALAAHRGVPVDSIRSEDLARGGTAARALMEELAGVVQEIERTGAQLKDVELGLVDFPAEIEGEAALLCWQFGETEIAFWHRADEGFASRRPLAGASATRILQ